MTNGMWQRTAIRLGTRNGGEEVVAGVEGVLPGKTATALLPSVRATREVAP